MILEKVLWTALPNHFDKNKRLRISLHVAPRLVNDDGSTAAGKVGECAAFSDWPKRLATLKFKVEFGNGVTAEGVPEQPADSALWLRLFPEDTPLQPFAFQDHAQRYLHVFPVRGVHTFVQQAYGAAAAQGIDHPSIDDPFGPLAYFAPLEHLAATSRDSHTFFDELARARSPKSGSGKVVHEYVASASLPPEQQAVANTFFEAYRFYLRPGSQNPDLPAKYIEPSPKPPTLDFHQRVSALADHPQVLRKLGLVIDLVVQLDSPSGQLPATGAVRVVPAGNLPESPPLAAWTHYELDKNWFGARPQQKARINRGLLDLNEAWELVQVDVDGAALQAVGFADTLRRMRDEDTRGPAAPDEAAVPALRSAGFALARAGRGEQLLEDLHGRKSKNDQYEAKQPPTFDAEDLVRGYRIDVRDADAPGGARWFSLHQRIADHEAPPPAAGGEPISFEIEDEGYVKATSAASERADHPSASDDLYLHETVFGWEGWSLAVPRPGKRIMEPQKGGETPLARHDPAAGSPPLVTKLSSPSKTLPRLRVGHRYRLRARTVDLAGNSRPFDPKDLEPAQASLASAEQAYRRFEPVPSPTVLRRHPDTEGESLENLAIRSDLSIAATAYATRPDVIDALKQAGADHVYAGDSQRHLAPPKASEQMTEQDGKLDAAFGGTPAAMTAALRVALREEGTFLDPKIVDTATGQKTVAQTKIVLLPKGTKPPAKRGVGLPGGAYAYYPDAAVVLPYLPDPMAI
ncbi:MAG TPA: hypothetical protein VMM27_14360, partial [Casimicrobiaceae bacterium]|nr:hypothetical protein [Casimicrobiaceae bacterium]